jgi:NitT/TauT family transport system ATP-binding protein
VLELQRVGKTFRAKNALVEASRDVDLSVAPGSITALVGPSGCGKSTLLHMIAGLYRPTSGSILQDGVPVTDVNPNVGYMTQKDNLFPWMSVRRNVAMPLEFAGVPAEVRRDRTDAVLRAVGLDGFADRYPTELSGGMRKRTSLARMLLYEPRTFLLDEPFGTLDPQLRLAMHQLLIELWLKGKQTIVLVTHDLEEAIALAQRVVVLTRRPARVAHEQEIDLPYPRDVRNIRFTERFKQLYDTLWERLRAQYEEGLL